MGKKTFKSPTVSSFFIKCVWLMKVSRKQWLENCPLLCIAFPHVIYCKSPDSWSNDFAFRWKRKIIVDLSFIFKYRGESTDCRSRKIICYRSLFIHTYSRYHMFAETLSLFLKCYLSGQLMSKCEIWETSGCVLSATEGPHNRWLLLHTAQGDTWWFCKHISRRKMHD